MDYQAIYDQRKSEIQSREDKLKVESVVNLELRKEIYELEDRLAKLKKKLGEHDNQLVLLKKPDLILSRAEQAVKIPWPVFLDYVTNTKAAWIYHGKMNPAKWRFFCKAPNCRSGGTRKIHDWERMGMYFLNTLSHGDWRLCDDCVGSSQSRYSSLTRKRSPNSTRPVINDSTIIMIDPFIYSDPKVIADLLRLGGVTVQ